jgi:hypothetical protein
MTIVRLAGGELVVHNAVACDEPTLDALAAIGPVRWIIVPSGHHRIDAPAFATRFADARVIAPAASIDRVRARCRVDGALDLLPADPALRWEPLDGVPAEAVFVHTDAGDAATAIFNDAFMNLPARLPGVKGLIVRMIGSTGGPKVTRTARWFIVKDGPAYAAHLRRIAALPGLARVIPGHGDVIRDPEASSAAIARAADGLHRAAA